VLLLQEAKDRLEGVIPAYSTGQWPEDQAENAEAVACWLNDCFTENAWLREARTTRLHLARLDKIDTALQEDDS
jgi:hypothetical protein